MSFSLVPSKEEYFFTSSEYGVPQNTYKIVESASPSYGAPGGVAEDSGPGILAEMSRFVRENVDKGVEAIKNLVPAFRKSPSSSSYGAPPSGTTYSLDLPAPKGEGSFFTPSSGGVPKAPPSLKSTFTLGSFVTPRPHSPEGENVPFSVGVPEGGSLYRAPSPHVGTKNLPKRRKATKNPPVLPAKKQPPRPPPKVVMKTVSPPSLDSVRELPKNRPSFQRPPRVTRSLHTQYSC